MDDHVLSHLRLARAFAVTEQEEGGNSRELSILITHIDTAVLWRQEDLLVKNGTDDANT